MLKANCNLHILLFVYCTGVLRIVQRHQHLNLPSDTIWVIRHLETSTKPNTTNMLTFLVHNCVDSFQILIKSLLVISTHNMFFQNAFFCLNHEKFESQLKLLSCFCFMALLRHSQCIETGTFLAGLKDLNLFLKRKKLANKYSFK